MDLTASILSVTNTRIPHNTDLEGINLIPILKGQIPKVERTLFWRTAVGKQNQRAVRSGDWKLLLDGYAAMLFDVRTDPSERHDLAKHQPDIARRLRILLAIWEQDVDRQTKR